MSAPEINKEVLEYLAGLARIQISGAKEGKLLQDMQNIVAFVSELQEVNTEGVEPMNGGTMLKNIFQDLEKTRGVNLGKGKEQFPESQNEYLKVPAVFGGPEQE